MKNLKLSIACLAMFAMLFASCSKEETEANLEQETATLSFKAIVNDLMNSRAANKQSVGDIPDCSDDVPAYVSIILSRDGVDIVGSDGDPFEIPLVEGQLFTEEVTELQLEPDTYSLEHFAVYNDDDEVIWIAPRVGSDLGGWIDNPLPLSIDLGPGVKKYVEVSVLCFDNRDVNEYGYLFFELETTEAIEFCFFANYCPPNSGDRHYTARYHVSVWRGTAASGTPIYTNVENTTGQYDNGDYYAEPLCLALPANDSMDEEYLYYEVTLLDWSGNYGTVTPNRVIAGSLSMNDIIANFEGENNVDYEHIRFGCADQEPMGDRDNDDVPDNVDACPDTPGPASNNGCPKESECVYEDACDIQAAESPCLEAILIGQEDNQFDFKQHFGRNSGWRLIKPYDYSKRYGDVWAERNDEGYFEIKIDMYEEYAITGYVLEVIPAEVGTNEMIENCRAYRCASNLSEEGIITETFHAIEINEGAYVRFKANVCPIDTDDDGIPDATDNCPTVPGPTDNNGCPTDSGCVYEEGCDTADAASQCETFSTTGTNNQTGSNADFDYYSAGFIQGGSSLTDPETGLSLGGYIAQINEEGFLEVYFRDNIGGLALSAYVIEVRPLDPITGKASETCREITCNSEVTLIPNEPYYYYTDLEVFSSITTNDSFFIRVKAVACP